MRTTVGADIYKDQEFIRIVKPLVRKAEVQEMRKYISHGYVDCFSHSVYVAYTAFKMGRRRGMDYKALARAGMLHDLYLYDWHYKGERKGLHGMTHAGLALKNAKKIIHLSHMEQDIIATHMWPLNPRLPRYRESVILMMADRYVTILETLRLVPTQPRLYR